MKKLILLVLVAFTFSCSSDDSPSQTPPTTNPIDTDPTAIAYVRGKMNNVTFDYTFNNSASDTFLHNSITGYSASDLNRWYYYGGSFTKFTPPTFKPELSIAWDNVYFDSTGNWDAETQAFYNSVSNLPTNFLTSQQYENHVAGISIQFVNEQNQLYNSIYGNQTGSTLVVLGSSESTAAGLQRKTVWGTFTCKLYNVDDLTDSIEITNGTFKMILTEHSL